MRRPLEDERRSEVQMPSTEVAPTTVRVAVDQSSLDRRGRNVSFVCAAALAVR